MVVDFLKIAVQPAIFNTLYYTLFRGVNKQTTCSFYRAACNADAVLRDSVCPSVCLSVCHTRVL